MTDHPLTETAAAALWDASRDPGRPAADRHEEMHHDERATALTAIRAAFNLGREHERTNPEDALRAAREQGWDQATRWIDSYQGGPNGRTDSARSANPHRTVPELPTKCGTVIVANDGRKFIKAEVDGIAHRAREAVLGANGWWYGAWRKAEGDGLLSAMFPEHISAPTWKVDGQ